MTFTIEQAKSYVMPPVFIPPERQEALCVQQTKEGLERFISAHADCATFRLVGQPWQNKDQSITFFYFDHPHHSAPENVVLTILDNSGKIQISCGAHHDLLLRTPNEAALSFIDGGRAEVVPVIGNGSLLARRATFPPGDAAIAEIRHMRLHAIGTSHHCGGGAGHPKLGA
jgi:hypothetical protein